MEGGGPFPALGELAAAVEGGEMKFAKVVFWVAGIWGLLVITPLYFIFDLIGKNDPPAITHPGKSGKLTPKSERRSLCR